MFCYKCGCELNSTSRCPNCGTDVTQYKKIIYTSNYLYNEGLEKAKVKDLSGAILCLKDSIWFNKNNLEARNLLGLCYYEIGEFVAALSEWVISKNLNDDRIHSPKNPADAYIAQIQESRQFVDNINTAIRRYNRALDCCYTDNLDVAVLQLKKVLTLNSHYLRARQLLALLFIEQKQYKKAQRELKKCLLLDVNNTTTLRYLQEVESKLSPEQTSEESVRNRRKKSKVPSYDDKNPGVIKYTADNETIIQPAGSKVPGVDGFGFPPMLTGLIIGLIVGTAVVFCLVLPARVQKVRTESAKEVKSVSDQLDTKEAEIAELNSQIDTLKAEDKAENADNKEGADTDSLMNAAAWYIKDPQNTSGNSTEAFAEIEYAAVDGYSDSFKALYDNLEPKMRSAMLDYFYLAGAKAYESETPDYDAVITALNNALVFDSDTEPSQAHPQMLYYLGDSYYQAYLKASDVDKAGKCKDYIARALAELQLVTADFSESDYSEMAAGVTDAIRSDENLSKAASEQITNETQTE